MRSKLKITIFSIGLLICLAALFYPTVANLWNSYLNSTLLHEYVRTVGEQSNEEYEKLWQEAALYNKYLGNEKRLKKLGLKYENIFNPNNNGIMGYLEIPRIRVELPIYHSLEEHGLQKGVGHMEDTALPIGTVGKRSVIAGHTGLANAKLLSDMDQMRIGDVFYIHLLDKQLTYQVVSSTVVLPTEADRLRDIPGEALVTLVTCTPFGINTHRLLVTGRLVAPEDVVRDADIYLSSEAEIVDAFFVLPVQMAAVAALFGLSAAMAAVIKTIKRKGEKHNEG